MDPSIEELINDINFEFGPTYVIKLDQQDKEWFLEHIEYESNNDLIRSMFWTRNSKDAIHFHDVDDIHEFIINQLLPRPVSIREIIV